MNASDSFERDKVGARAIVGSVKGSELARIYAQHGFRIYDINIRNFLGNVKINQGISRTAADRYDAKHFWFYNNGVTFICDEYSFRSLEDTVVRLVNAQVVNGCQTVTTLAHVGNALSDDVEVLVRVIEKKGDIEFIRSVTLFANSQNAVRPADLVGTDTLQLELKRFLLGHGYYYETRRGDYKAEKDSLQGPIKEVVTLKEVAQALATIYKQLPGLAKKDTSKLFAAKRDGGFYEDVFRPETSPEQVIAAVSIMNSIPKLRKWLEQSLASQNAPIPAWLLHSDSFMAAMFYAVSGDDQKSTDNDYLLRYAGWVQDVTNAEVRSIYQGLVSEVDTVVKKAEKIYGYSHPRFFKTQPEYEKQLKPIAKKQVKQF